MRDTTRARLPGAQCNKLARRGPTAASQRKYSPRTAPPAAFPRRSSPSAPSNTHFEPFFVCWASFFALTRRLQCRWASFFALTPTSGRAGRRMSRTKRGNMATLKPASPLRPKTALKTPISHPQRRWRFQTTGPPGRQSQAEAPAGPEAMSSPAISHLVPFTRTWARWHARGPLIPHVNPIICAWAAPPTRISRG